VLQAVVDGLGLTATPRSLAQSFAATSDINTAPMSISVPNESPAQTAAIAQPVSRSLIDAVDELEKPSQGGSSTVKLSIVTPAAGRA
jgi:capsular polysaccharide biosynthesis protein